MNKFEITLNNKNISIRKFKELFGEEATKDVKKQLKNICFQIKLNTEFGLLEIKNILA